MHQDNVGTYGGVAGRVFAGAFTLGTIVTTFLVGVGVVLEAAAFGAADLPAVAALSMMALVTLAMSRLALNAFHGDWTGSVLSLVGGSWKEVFLVSLRFTALMAAWFAPLIVGTMVLGATMAATSGAMGALNMPVPQPPIPLLFYAISGMLFHPAALIIAVSAPDFGSIFQPAHWSTVFSGRKSELVFLCAVTCGGPMVVYVLVSPLVVGLMSSGVQAAIVGVVIFASLIGGYWLTLFSKLCGFFARGSREVNPWDEQSAPQSGSPLPRYAQANAPGSFAAPAPAPPPPAPVAPSAIPLATAGAVPAAVSPGVIPLGSPPPAAPAPAPTPQAAAPASVPLATPGPIAQAPAPAPAAPAVPPPGSAGPPLLEAEQRVAELRHRHEQDPAALATELRAIHEEHAPHPAVLHALVQAEQASGNGDGAIAAARDAVPTCLAVGNTELAAEVLAALGPKAMQITLDDEARLTLAGALKPLGHLRLAARLYAAALQAQPEEPRAVKGMLQIGELMCRGPEGPADAVKVYRFLLEAAPNSPLRDFIEDGLRDAERRLVRA